MWKSALSSASAARSKSARARSCNPMPCSKARCESGPIIGSDRARSSAAGHRIWVSRPGTRSAVEIGDRNVIREHVTIHRGTAADSATRLGNDNFLMAGAHLGHNCTVGNKVIIANNCLLGGYVTVDDGAFLGGGCGFHQFVRVGRLAMTQGNSGFWERRSAVLRRGGDQPGGRSQCDRAAARGLRRRRAGGNQSSLSTSLRERSECQPGAGGGAWENLE